MFQWHQIIEQEESTIHTFLKISKQLEGRSLHGSINKARFLLSPRFISSCPTLLLKAMDLDLNNPPAFEDEDILGAGVLPDQNMTATETEARGGGPCGEIPAAGQGAPYMSSAAGAAEGVGGVPDLIMEPDLGAQENSISDAHVTFT